MWIEKVFRFSIYVTLAVASAGLCSAERYFIAEINYFLLPALFLVVIAYFVEGRWTLSAFASNCFGVLIAAGAALWIARSLAAPTNQLIENAPYPAAFLPFGGPILILVMLAKLFRPKRISDYWGLYVIGLMQMALGGILAGDPEFSFWLFAYIVGTLWSLMWFSLYRDMVRSHGDGTSAEATRSSAVVPLRGWGAWLTAKRAVFVAALTVPLFLLMPRQSNERWHLLNSTGAAVQVETGFSPQIDLTPTGRVNVSDEVALEVRVRDAAGNPKTDLDPFQRWRGSTLHIYSGGQWQSRSISRISGPPPGIEVPAGKQPALSDLGPQTFTVTYDFDVYTLRGLFLAEPVAHNSDSRLAICVLGDDPPWRPFFHARDRILRVPSGRDSIRAIRYQQALHPVNAGEADVASDISDSYLNWLHQQPVGGIRTWTLGILDRLASNGQLPRECVTMAPNRHLGAGGVLPEHHAKVARALSDYLSSSGDFLYRLELRRSDLTLDPSEDFLRNVKQGFCAHFSTGLALMLRSVGIPARVITGFRGAEYQAGAEGVVSDRYVIRQSHAHSWVEALWERQGPDGAAKYEWLMLDPTSGDGAQGSAGLTWEQWLAYARSTLRDIWNGMVLDYSTDRQSDTFATMWHHLRSLGPVRATTDWMNGEFRNYPWGWGAGILGIAFGIWWLWRWRLARNDKSIGPVRPEFAFYARWLEIIQRHTALQPSPAQTPREFAERVMHTWPHRPTNEILQATSRFVVTLLYRARYGGDMLDDTERRLAEDQVAELDTRLRAENALV